MYLARKTIKGTVHFFIRESYYEDTCFKSRNLIELGPDPLPVRSVSGGKRLLY